MNSIYETVSREKWINEFMSQHKCTSKEACLAWMKEFEDWNIEAIGRLEDEIEEENQWEQDMEERYSYDQDGMIWG